MVWYNIGAKRPTVAQIGPDYVEHILNNAPPMLIAPSFDCSCTSCRGMAFPCLTGVPFRFFGPVEHLFYLDV